MQTLKLHETVSHICNYINTSLSRNYNAGSEACKFPLYTESKLLSTSAQCGFRGAAGGLPRVKDAGLDRPSLALPSWRSYVWKTTNNRKDKVAVFQGTVAGFQWHGSNPKSEQGPVLTSSPHGHLLALACHLAHTGQEALNLNFNPGSILGF